MVEEKKKVAPPKPKTPGQVQTNAVTNGGANAATAVSGSVVISTGEPQMTPEEVSQLKIKIET